MSAASVATRTNGMIALELRDAGIVVIPNCWADRDGKCGYAGHYKDGALIHEPKDTGKVPLLSGWQSNRPTREEVRNAFRRYPDANVAINLALSGVLDVNPDSDAAGQEAQDKGVEGGIIRHSKNTAYLFKRPADCPILTTTNQGEDGHLEIRASGQCIVHGRHREGQDIYLDVLRFDEMEFAPAPAWAVDMLKQAEARRPKAQVPDLDDGDEPPVRLNEQALRAWVGQVVVDRADRQIHQRTEQMVVDRSDTLFVIGRNLADANASRHTIVDALGDRDVKLGFDKYAGRPDGGRTEYERIAHKALAPNPNDTAPLIHGPPKETSTETRGCLDLVAQLDQARARTADLESTIARLNAERTLFMKAVTNPALKTLAPTAMTIAFKYFSAESRNKLDESGYFRLAHSVVGDKAGISPETAARQTKQLATRGFLDRKVTTKLVPVTDPTTGRVSSELQSEQWVKVNAENVVDYLEHLATYKRPEAEDQKGKWGGKRGCPEHPNARIVRVCYCEECGQQVGEKEFLAPQQPDEPPTYQDASPGKAPPDAAPPDSQEGCGTTYGCQVDRSGELDGRLPTYQDARTEAPSLLAPSCPTCGGLAERQGDFVTDDGRARFVCRQCVRTNPRTLAFLAPLQVTMPDRERFERLALPLPDSFAAAPTTVPG